MLGFINRGTKKGFTIMELVMTGFIVLTLTAMIVPFVSNYITQTRRTTSEHTLSVLNEALDKYKTFGSDMSGLTITANFQDIVSLLKTGYTMYGSNHASPLLSPGQTFLGRSVKMAGDGVGFRFYAYEYYEGPYPDDPRTPTTDFPNGKPMLYVSNGGGSTYSTYITSSTGWIACENASGGYTYIASNTTVELPASHHYYMWGCAGDGDNRMTGDLTKVRIINSNLTSVNLAPLNALLEVELYNNSLTSLGELPNSVTYLRADHNNIATVPEEWPSGLATCWLYDNDISSITVPWPSTIKEVFLDRNYSLSHISDIPEGATKLHVSYCNFTSLPAMPSTLNDLQCRSNTISGDVDWSSLTGLTYVLADNNNFTSISGFPPNVSSFNFDNNSVGSITGAVPSSMRNLRFGGNSTLTVLPALNAGLEKLEIKGTSVTSLPSLPLTIYDLGLEDTDGLTSLTDLPNAVINLRVHNSNNLTSIDALPSSLKTIIAYSTALTSLPAFPSGMTSIRAYAAPIASMDPSNLTDACTYFNIRDTDISLSTALLDSFYASLPDVSGGNTNNLYIGTSAAAAATDATATAKGWTVLRAN